MMITEERLQKLPDWIQRTTRFLTKIKVPAKIVYVLISLFATLWFLFRVIPKPSRALYPCMQVAAPIMSGFVIWILTISGTVLAFKKAKHKLFEAKYATALLFLILGIGAVSLFAVSSSPQASANNLKIWYRANIPLGVAKGMFPGRVAWGHNPKIASWDGKNGFWWEDKYNNQNETDKLFKNTLFSLTNKKTEKDAWAALFTFYNKNKRNHNTGYQQGEKIAIKINMNNTDAHESSNRINANPQLILSLLRSLINEAGVAQENIIVSDPSRFITNNIYDKCHAVFPKVRFEDHNGGDGREKATFVENGFLYSFDFDRQTKGLAKSFVDADYIINMALMKGHVTQGVSLVAKNFFGCVDIETDWRKNAHCSGFSQSREGKRQYSVYPDFIGHKNLGEKTILYLIDGIYSNKFVDGVPEFRWKLTPFNNDWPNSLFASQDAVAIESVVLDFALTEWPDAPDMMYSDYAMEEMALANNPPSGAIYDPERDGTKLTSLGVTEHWNNPIDKQYSRNLNKGEGIELVYSLINK
ncbi:MAG: DUF362 domain-containing protein [Sedimentisphaerales bacterium]|jgi:hypothetical protein